MSKLDRDDYLTGEFEIGNLTLHGNILINSGKKALLLCIQRKVDDVGYQAFPYCETIEGRLTNGAIVALFFCNCVKNTTYPFSHQDIVYRAEFLVFGTTEKNFDQIDCVVENALLWSELTQLNTSSLIEIKQQYCEGRTLHWFDSEVSFSTVLKNELNTIPRHEVCTVEERLAFSIRFDEKKNISDFIKIRDNVMSMISFAIKDNVNITDQFLVNTDDYEEYGKDYKEPHRYQLFTTEENTTILGTHQIEYNFKLSDLSDSANVQETIKKLVPVINLYLSLYKYPHMPVEMVFLNLIQAVETLHARFFYGNNKDDYVKSVHSRFDQHPQFDFIKDLLLSNGQDNEKCRQIYLISRINDLLLNDYDPLFWSYYRKGSTFAQQVIDTRNYYTHYDEAKKEKALSGDYLIEAIFVLRLLLELYICRFLGIDLREKTGHQLSNFKISKPDYRATSDTTNDMKDDQC